MPTVDIPDKICPHCGGTRWEVTVRKPSNTFRYRCKKQRTEYLNVLHKKWRAEGRVNYLTKVREKNRRYYERNKEKISAECKRKRLQNAIANPRTRVRRKTDEEIRQARNRYNKKYIDSIKGTEKYSQRIKRKDSNKRKNMAGSYLRKNLVYHCGVPKEAITEDMLNKYRVYLSSRRLLKQLENEKSSNINQKVGAY